MESTRKNVDERVVADFGKEWKTFNQEGLSGEVLHNAFNQYFHLFPFHKINAQSVGFDMGCGSGRWAKLMAPRVGTLNCIDPSPAALNQARANLEKQQNCTFECASVSGSTLANASQAEPALKAIPEVVLKVFPYVVTLLALIFFSKSTQAPRAAGEPFEKGKR